jgi:hypothetical protein
MNTLRFLPAFILGAALIAALPAQAQTTTASTATAGSEGVFAGGASIAGVSISGADTGLGVSVLTDGTATGEYQTLLLGTNALGQSQDIDLDGQAQAGIRNADGSVTISGSGLLDMGDGTPPANATFTVTLVGGGSPTMQLLLNGAALPLETITSGSVTIN